MKRFGKLLVILMAVLLMLELIPNLSFAAENKYKVMVINFDPVFEMADKKRQHELISWWNDPHWLVDQFAADMKEISHGYANYEVVEWIDIDELPKDENGKSYSKAEYYSILQDALNYDGAYWDYPVWKEFEGHFDYDSYLTKYDVYVRVDSGEIDEVWVFTGPCIGASLWETQMVGKDAIWCNSEPLIKDCKTFVVYGFNYERGVGEMLEDAGHRAESIMNSVFGSADFKKDYSEFSDWEKFFVHDLAKPGKAGVGSIHFAPNSLTGYEWGNTTYVYSTCNDWSNYPDMNAEPELVNCETWGNGDIRAHHKWWFSLLPHADGRNDKTSKYNNWWVYFTLQYLNDPNYHDQWEDTSDIHGVCGPSAAWTLNSNGVLLIEGDGRISSAPWLEAHREDIKSVVIDSGITSLGYMPFQDCINLVSITIPNTVKDLGGYTFWGCSSLKSVTIPEGVEVINDHTFYNCNSLTSVDIPSGVTTIGVGAFWGCTSLQSVHFPDSVSRIGEQAFLYCSSLKSVNIPNGVTKIGESTFEWCTNLQEILLPNSITQIGRNAFHMCSNLKSANIPDGITAIEDFTFGGCRNLEAIVIPDSVKSIGIHAFETCEKLTDIHIPDGVPEIGEYTFDGCRNLESVSLPDSVTFIGNHAFATCTHLEEIVLHDNIRTISNYAFSDCAGLENVTVGAVDSIEDYAFHGISFVMTFLSDPPKFSSEALSSDSDYTKIIAVYPHSNSRWSTVVSNDFGGNVVWIPDNYLVSSDSPRDTSEELVSVDSNNINNHDYTVWSKTVKSYIIDNNDGTFSRIEWRAGTVTYYVSGEVIRNPDVVTVEIYNSEFSLIWKKSIEIELPLWGGFYAGEDYNFFVFGQNNEEENNEKPVIRVVRYSKNWHRIDSVDLCGANTTIPFYAGSLRMAECGDILYIHSAHEIYTMPDGLNHQANLSLDIYIPTMTIIRSGYTVGNPMSDYTAHSFNQFVTIDDDFVVKVDHGDAYPRAVVLHRRDSAGSIALGNSERKNILEISGETGANATGVSVGGLEVSDTHYLVVGNSVDQITDYSPGSVRNIFVSATQKEGFNDEDSSTITWITNYTESNNPKASTPFLIKRSDNSFILIWQEEEYSEQQDYNFCKICYVMLDGQGRVVSEIYRSSGCLSDCKPIIVSNKLIWYVTYYSKPALYSIDLANMKVDSPLRILTLLEDSTAESEDEVSFSIDVNGVIEYIEWQYSDDNGLSWTEDYYNSDYTYSFTASLKHNNRLIRCVITDVSGEQVISNSARITVISGLKILAHPENCTVRTGEWYTFSVEAEGYMLEYQWERSRDNGETWEKCPYYYYDSTDLYDTGSTTNKYTCMAFKNNNDDLFRCVITEKDGDTVISEIARLTVIIQLEITSQPRNQSVIDGSEASFTITAQGTGIKYQWQYSDNGTGWQNANITTNILTVTATKAMDGRQYRCVLTDSAGNTLTSNSATLTVTDSLGITSQPQNQTVIEGSTATFTITAQGTSIKYQWQYSDNGSSWQNADSTTNTLMVTATKAIDGRKYRCALTDSAGNTLTSNVATLTVTDSLGITSQPQNQTVIEGSTATFTITAQGTGIKYQWQYSDNGSSWQIANNTTNTLTITATKAMDGRKYRCVLTDSAENTLTSNTATLTVTDSLGITSHPQNQTVIDGLTATFTITAQGTGIKYQWQYSDNGSSWQNANSTTNTLTVTATKTMDGRQYRCVLTDSAGNTLTSNTATLTVEPVPVVPPANIIGDIDANGSVDNADLVTLARHIVGLRDFTADETLVADMNGDGMINNSDLVILARVIVGL